MLSMLTDKSGGKNNTLETDLPLIPLTAGTAAIVFAFYLIWSIGATAFILYFSVVPYFNREQG